MKKPASRESEGRLDGLGVREDNGFMGVGLQRLTNREARKQRGGVLPDRGDLASASWRGSKNPSRHLAKAYFGQLFT
jgi:hypothetical protein